MDTGLIVSEDIGLGHPPITYRCRLAGSPNMLKQAEALHADCIYAPGLKEELARGDQSPAGKKRSASGWCEPFSYPDFQPENDKMTQSGCWEVSRSSCPFYGQ